MTDTIGTYSFLPWARQGLGTRIQDASTGIRASVPVTLSITADLIAGGQSTESLPRHVQLYGPGDVIGVDADAVVRTDPRHLVTNFETNYLPYIEFYEEDFPWRYTPAAPSAGDSRVAPWLTLAVLAEGEFTMASTSSARPLPAIDVTNPADVLPTHATLWAWGHVHVNAALGGTRTDSVGNAASLAAIVADNRDRAYSRLLSPRILRANTAYHAFLIPSFEAGRLAGIGRDPAAATSPTQPAWAVERTSADDRLFPVYYRWYFRTGEVGDFEYLVRLLEPRTVDPQVGRRPMDTLKPGSNLPSIPELGGILRLGGALRAPSSTLSDADLAEYLRFEKWASPGPHTFQTALSSLINLAADYSEQTPATANSASGIAGVSGNQDPLIVPPLYGRWHAQVMRLTPANADPDASHWVDELNLDPRHRVAAGLGTGVVQRNQESYMESAWLQVGKVLAANARIRFGHMAMLTSLVWHRRRLGHFGGTDDEGLLSITAPVHRRVLTGASTIAHAVKTSLVPPVLVSTSLRKTLRPRARVVRLGALSSATEGRGLLTRVNAGVISAAPPKQVPPSARLVEPLD